MASIGIDIKCCFVLPDSFTGKMNKAIGIEPLHARSPRLSRHTIVYSWQQPTNVPSKYELRTKTKQVTNNE